MQMHVCMSVCAEQHVFVPAGERLVMILDDWISDRAAESDTQSTDAGSSSPWEEAQQGVWYDGGPPDLVDNYLQAPTPKDQGILGGLEQAINGWLSLPDTYPTPVVRLLFRNLSAMLVLHESTPSQQGEDESPAHTMDGWMMLIACPGQIGGIEESP